MPEMPPIWDQPDQPQAQAPRHRSSSNRPQLPIVFGVVGLMLGVVATLLVSRMGGSHHHQSAAVAPLPTRSASVAGPVSSAARSSSKSATVKKPISSAPISLPPANENGLSHAAPTGVQIPKIGVSSSLESLGLAPDGTLEAPVDFAKAGWYAQGPYPGDANEPPAIIAGHVDDYRGPAVFFKLKQLTAGDRVLVPRTDGSTATFVVYQTQTYSKDAFPAASVYASTKRPELRLITCTGQFDSNARSYLSNFVAYAYLESGTR